MWFFGKDRGAVMLAKVKKLQEQNFAATGNCLEQFYKYLTVLDGKATGLLTVNTLFIAVLVVFLASGEQITQHWDIPFSRPVLELQLAAVCFSALLCLLVVSVSWNFLAQVAPTATKADDFEGELSRLANVVDDRTHYYWMAWHLALVALVLTLGWWSGPGAALGVAGILVWVHRDALMR